MIFKAGDKVRCIAKHCGESYGKEFEVIGISSGGAVRVVKAGNIKSFHPANLEIVIPEVKEEEKKEFHSSHYESDSIEPIEFMMSNKMDFCRASIIKYAFRAGKKEGQEALDIKKIIDYALLLATQEGIPFTKEDAQSIIDYRFDWEGKRK